MEIRLLSAAQKIAGQMKGPEAAMNFKEYLWDILAQMLSYNIVMSF